MTEKRQNGWLTEKIGEAYGLPLFDGLTVLEENARSLPQRFLNDLQETEPNRICRLIGLGYHTVLFAR